jgi:hypothetical protein
MSRRGTLDRAASREDRERADGPQRAAGRSRKAALVTAARRLAEAAQALVEARAHAAAMES